MDDYLPDDYSQYDITEEDCYLIPDSECLKNNLGFTNTADLNAAEQALTKLTMAELVNKPVNPTYDLAHWLEIHRRIFCDVYPFAGAVRQVEISKGSKLFLPYQLIEEESEACFEQLAKENDLKGLDPRPFGERAGFFLGWINKIHPAREGNGRTQREMLNQLARQNGYEFVWSAISDKAMGGACREARISDPKARKLSRLLSLHIATSG